MLLKKVVKRATNLMVKFYFIWLKAKTKVTMDLFKHPKAALI